MISYTIIIEILTINFINLEVGRTLRSEGRKLLESADQKDNFRDFRKIFKIKILAALQLYW